MSRRWILPSFPPGASTTSTSWPAAIATTAGARQKEHDRTESGKRTKRAPTPFLLSAVAVWRRRRHPRLRRRKAVGAGRLIEIRDASLGTPPPPLRFPPVPGCTCYKRACRRALSLGAAWASSAAWARRRRSISAGCTRQRKSTRRRSTPVFEQGASIRMRSNSPDGGQGGADSTQSAPSRRQFSRNHSRRSGWLSLRDDPSAIAHSLGDERASCRRARRTDRGSSRPLAAPIVRPPAACWGLARKTSPS